jgi:hypothetical protein
MLSKELSNFALFGTPAKVSMSKVRGADLMNADRTRLCIAWGRVGDLPQWKDPWTGDIFRSKDYELYTLSKGQNFYDFFHLKQPSPKVVLRDPMVNPRDKSLVPTVSVEHLSSQRIGQGSQIPSVTHSDLLGAHSSGQPNDDDAPMISQTPKAAADITLAEIDNLTSDPSSFIGETCFKRWIIGGVDKGVCKGEVAAYDDTRTGPKDRPWAIAWDDGGKSNFHAMDMINYCLNHIDGDRVTQIFESDSEVESDSSDEQTFATTSEKNCEDKREYLESQNLTWYTTSDNDTWTTLCNAMSINHGQRKAFYTWLSARHGYGHKPTVKAPFRFVNPYGSSSKTHRFRAGIPFPYPSGGEWDSLTAPVQVNHIMTVLHMIENERQTLDKLSYKFPIDRLECAAKYNITESEIQAAMDRMDEWIDMPQPKSYAATQQRPDAVLFRLAFLTEVAAFEKLKVMSFGHTQDQLTAWDIEGTPVPLLVLPSVKIEPDGSYDKHKIRICLCGSPFYMTRGVHFFHTYAATADICSIRLITVVGMLLDWDCRAWDISTAYLQADRDKCTQVALRLPQGFRTNDSSGNELFGILHSNLYGNPEAAFTWMQTLVRWMMETFNANGWSATMCRTDSAVCVIHDPHGITAFVVTYVDDCLAYSPSDDVLKFIQDKYNDRFGVTVRNPEFYLGVRRVITRHEDGRRTLELTMPEYVSNLADEFREHMPDEVPELPWPAGFIIGMKETDYKPSQADQTKYKKLGYLRLVGSLLWCMRMCYCDLALGVSLAASVMSAPSKEAWEAALGMLAYLEAHAHEGITYTSDYSELISSREGSHTLHSRMIHAHVDSGHNQFGDGKAQGGFGIYLAGGPIDFLSQKHEIVTDSTLYSEYVALWKVGKRVEVVLNLIDELGDAVNFLKRTVPIFCDNDNAVGKAMGTKNTPQSKHIALKYHYIMQLCEDDTVIVLRVPSKDNRADLLTKPVGLVVFDSLRDRLLGRTARL